jgi:hypothetical protein
LTHSEQDLIEIPRDRARLRAYFWRIAQHHRRLAAENRRPAQSGNAFLAPIVGGIALAIEPCQVSA